MLSYPQDFWKTYNGKNGLQSRVKIPKSELTDIENETEWEGKEK